MVDFFREFHERDLFQRSLNTTFLVLVSKKGGIIDLMDLRLIGCLDKRLTKVLANRLQKVMGSMVSKCQNSFVEGKQIFNAMLIENKDVDSAYDCE